MADEGTQSAATPTPAVPSEGSQPAAGGQPARTVPEGHAVVSEQELANLRRMAEGYKGQQPLAQEMAKHGLKTREDVERFGGTYQQVQKAGVDLGQLLSAIQADANQSKPAQADPNSLEALKASIMGEVQTGLAKERHDAAFKAESNWADEFSNRVAGDGASDHTKLLAQSLVNEVVSRSTQTYPEGHPLAGQPMPLSSSQFAEAEKLVTETWREIRGRQIAESAQAVTPTAGAGTQGAAANASGGPASRSGGLPSKEAILAHWDRAQASRGGAPLSQA